MSNLKSHPDLAPLLHSRRAFLQSSCSFVGIAAAMAACNSAWPGEFTTVIVTPGGSSSIDFDVALPEFAALATVGGMVGVDSGSTKVLLIRASATSVEAFGRICPHAQADLAPDQQGSYDAASSTLTCNLHNSKFDATGKCTSGPALGKSLKTYQVTFDSVTGKGSVSLGVSVDFDVAQAPYTALATVGGMADVDSGSTKVLLIRATTDKVEAFGRICPHAQADLGPDQQGTYDAASSTLTCNLHNSKFDATGACTSGPALGKSLKTYVVTFDSATGKGSVSL
jgi:nitrite reductase/ring-hydroxylating ferredoxin subunit